MQSFKAWCKTKSLNENHSESAEDKNRQAAYLVKKQIDKLKEKRAATLTGGGLGSGSPVADAYVFSNLISGLGEILVALLSGGSSV